MTVQFTKEEERQIYHKLKKEYLLEDIQSRYNIPPDKTNEILDRVENSLSNNDSYWESYWLTIDYVCQDFQCEEKED